MVITCMALARCKRCVDTAAADSSMSWHDISRLHHGHGRGTVHELHHPDHARFTPEPQYCGTCEDFESPAICRPGARCKDCTVQRKQMQARGEEAHYDRVAIKVHGHWEGNVHHASHPHHETYEKWPNQCEGCFEVATKEQKSTSVAVGDVFVGDTYYKNCEFAVEAIDTTHARGRCTSVGHNHVRKLSLEDFEQGKSVWKRKKAVEIGDVFVGTHSDFTGCEFTVESLSKFAAYGDCKIEGHTHTLVLKLELFREGKSIWKRKEESTVRPLRHGDLVTPVSPGKACPSADCEITVKSFTASNETARAWCRQHQLEQYISVTSFEQGTSHWKYRDPERTVRKRRIQNEMLCTIDIRCEGCDYLVSNSLWQYVEAASFRHGHADGTIHHAKHPNHHTAPDQQNCACKEFTESNRYRFEGTITKVERLPCPDCRTGEELNASVLCNKCGAKHRCKHSNTRCTEFKPTCPHCRTVLARPLSANAIGLPQVVIRFRGGSAYHTCNRCGEEFPSTTEMSEQQLTFTEENMATVKTYKIEALKEHVDNYLEAVAELDDAIAAHNEQQKATYLDRMTTYLDEGKYTDPETQEEIDHSDRPLDDRRQHLSVGRVFALSTARHNFGTDRAKRLLRILNSLEGETVELDPDEALDYLALPERTQEAKETTERYQTAEDEETEE